MKIKRVFANNRKKCFVLETSNGVIEYPYSEISSKKSQAIRPSAHNPVIYVHADQELASQGFSYTLKSGKQNSILLDQVLFYQQDPDYLRELLLHNLTVKALRTLNTRDISKRELSRKLKTSPRQLYRLLDPAFYGKTIDQMVKLLHALGMQVEISVQKLAA